MKTNPLPERIKQMAAITSMERGNLSVIRIGPDGRSYYNFQHRENGRNVTEYIPREQLPAVQANIAAYQRFKALVDEHVAEISGKSRQQRKAGIKKKTSDEEIFDLARQQEVPKLIAAFRSAQPGGALVADLEKLLRTAIFKPAADLVGQLLQEAADKIDAAYQPKPGEVRKGRQTIPKRRRSDRDWFPARGSTRRSSPSSGLRAPRRTITRNESCVRL